MKFRVVKITNNVPGYPECAKDTEEFPHMVSYVEDEMALFIVEVEKPTNFWPSSEFFYMVDVVEFEVTK